MGPRHPALELAQRVLAIEADAVRALIDRLDERFLAALSLVLECRDRVIVSGVSRCGETTPSMASTNTASTTMPAKTPVTSNVPSASWMT